MHLLFKNSRTELEPILAICAQILWTTRSFSIHQVLLCEPWLLVGIDL